MKTALRSSRRSSLSQRMRRGSTNPEVVVSWQQTAAVGDWAASPQFDVEAGKFYMLAVSVNGSSTPLAWSNDDNRMKSFRDTSFGLVVPLGLVAQADTTPRNTFLWGFIAKTTLSTATISLRFGTTCTGRAVLLKMPVSPMQPFTRNRQYLRSTGTDGNPKTLQLPTASLAVNDLLGFASTPDTSSPGSGFEALIHYDPDVGASASTLIEKKSGSTDGVVDVSSTTSTSLIGLEFSREVFVSGRQGPAYQVWEVMALSSDMAITINNVNYGSFLTWPISGAGRVRTEVLVPEGFTGRVMLRLRGSPKAVWSTTVDGGTPIPGAEPPGDIWTYTWLEACSGLTPGVHTVEINSSTTGMVARHIEFYLDAA